MEVKKVNESNILSHFLKTNNYAYSGLELHEQPDFILKIGNKKIGIEVTETISQESRPIFIAFLSNSLRLARKLPFGL